MVEVRTLSARLASSCAWEESINEQNRELGSVGCGDWEIAPRARESRGFAVGGVPACVGARCARSKRTHGLRHGQRSPDRDQRSRRFERNQEQPCRYWFLQCFCGDIGVPGRVQWLRVNGEPELRYQW